MTLSTTANKVIHTTDGIQTVFAYDYLVLDESHMVAYLDDTLIDPGDYTVGDIGEPTGGDVTFAVAPATGQLTLLREVPITQLIDYNDYDPFPAATHETGLDLGTMVDQQQQEEIDRSIKAPVYQPVAVDYTLPAYDAGKALMWTESDPKGITNSDDEVNGIVAAALAAQAAAEAAQAAAELAQTGAETSETNAATSETNAEAWAEALPGADPPGTTSGSAKAWAQTAEDTPVVAVPTQYSAFHWAKKAEEAALSGLRTVSEHTATAGQTDFTHTVAIVNETIFLNGAALMDADYSTDDVTLTLTVGATAGDQVKIITLGNVGISEAFTTGQQPVGSVELWPLATPPSGWLELDGSSISASTYPELVELLNPGQPNATLPDMRGNFARGWDDGTRGLDPDVRTLLDEQTDEFESHQHTEAVNTNIQITTVGGAYRVATNNAQLTGATGGDETRPVNMAWMFIIKAEATPGVLNTLSTNLLINPEFRINQRGYVSGASLLNGIYGYDRWAASGGAITCTLTGKQMTIGGSNKMKQTVESLTVPAGNYTLSWVGTSQASVDGGALTNSPVEIVHAGGDMEIEFDAGTVLNPILVAGTDPGYYSERHFAEELALCQRYYCKSYNLEDDPGTIITDGAVRVFTQAPNVAYVTATGASGQFPVTMRTAPTCVVFSPVTGLSNRVRMVSADKTPSSVLANQTSIYAQATDSSSTSRSCYFHYTADAEF